MDTPESLRDGGGRTVLRRVLTFGTPCLAAAITLGFAGLYETRRTPSVSGIVEAAIALSTALAFAGPAAAGTMGDGITGRRIRSAAIRGVFGLIVYWALWAVFGISTYLMLKGV